jgi:hypothetical protein
MLNIKVKLKCKNNTMPILMHQMCISTIQVFSGTQGLFNKLLCDFLGMFRQLGSSTWFLTLSSADMKLKDTIQVIAAQHNQKLSDEQVESITWE